ncbi:hypothetical protein BSAF29S_00618 [Bacillus safensis subsp. safensis]
MTAVFSPSLMCMDLTHFREQIHLLKREPTYTHRARQYMSHP